MFLYSLSNCVPQPSIGHNCDKLWPQLKAVCPKEFKIVKKMLLSDCSQMMREAELSNATPKFRVKERWEVNSPFLIKNLCSYQDLFPSHGDSKASVFASSCFYGAGAVQELNTAGLYSELCVSAQLCWVSHCSDAGARNPQHRDP